MNVAQRIQLIRIIEKIEKNPEFSNKLGVKNTSDFISDIPGVGYLGTARVISGKHKDIGFHAWEQNDYEFVYYSLF